MRYSKKNELKAVLLSFRLAFISSCYHGQMYKCQFRNSNIGLLNLLLKVRMNE